MTLCTICGDPFWSSSRAETCPDCRKLNLAAGEQQTRAPDDRPEALALPIETIARLAAQQFGWLREEG